MNRLYTLLLLAGLTLSAQAQTIEFRFQGKAVADKDTVTVYSEEDEWGEFSCESNPASDPNNGLILANLTDALVEGTATLTIEENTQAPQRIQWCMGGQCEIITSTPYDKKFGVPAKGSILTQFDTLPTQYGELNATITARVPGQTLSVVIHCVHSKDAHVGDLTQDGTTKETFDLMGRRMTGTLKPGLYIRGSRKTIVR